MSNTNKQKQIRTLRRSMFVAMQLKGVSENVAIMTIQKHTGGLQGLEVYGIAQHKFDKATADKTYKPTFVDCAQFAPRLRRGSGWQRAGYRLSAAAGVNEIGKLECMVPVNSFQNESGVNTETSRAETKHKRQARKAAKEARIHAIQEGKENQSLLSMAQLMEINRSKESINNWTNRG